MAGSEIFDKARVVYLKFILDVNGLSPWDNSSELYSETAPTQAERIRNVVANRNIDPFSKSACGLKSASANLGAKRLSVICLALETAGSNQVLRQLKALMLEFNRRFLEVLLVINEKLTRLQNNIRERRR